MLKRPITYTNYDDEEVTEDFYFYLSQPQLLELEVEIEGGLVTLLQRIIDTEDQKEILAQFKKIILAAYGERSEDGKRFIKSPEISEAFSQTAAYPVLFMELTNDDNAAVAFLKGALPKDMVAEINRQEAEDAKKKAEEEAKKAEEEAKKAQDGEDAPVAAPI